MLHGCRFARLILIAAVVATASVGRAKVSKSISTTNSNIITFKSDDGRYSFSVDCSAAPDLADWAETRLKPVVSEWYGRLADDFASPGYRPRPSIGYRLRKDMKVPGLKHGTTVDLNINWIRKHPDNVKLGMVIHETWHTLQRYKSKPPKWLSEGITDWVRYYYYEKSPQKVNLAKARANAGYAKTAAFLEWCNGTDGEKFVASLIRDLRTGDYDGEAWWKRKTGQTFEELEAAWKTGRPRKVEMATTP